MTSARVKVWRKLENQDIQGKIIGSISQNKPSQTVTALKVESGENDRFPKQRGIYLQEIS
ncbi:hypothetical protein [Anabaena sp. CCY 0017]|uniref:hypothetical protein n=1 Tax=Anabaena sp. CCY 0017 TaxID=3103866 RepID=UPI0039C75BCD